MKVLKVELNNVKLRNPLLLASGILGITPSLLKRAELNGAGGVVTKTVTKDPRRGNTNPVLVELPYGFINSMGLPNPGIDYFIKKIKEAKKILSIPIIVSIGPSTIEEAEYISSKLKDIQIDGIEINASCPHVKGHGLNILSDPDLLRGIIETLRKKFKDKLILVKLSPMIQDVVKVSDIIISSGADGFVATNTIRAIAIDVWARQPILSNIYGGLSGPALKPIAVRIVYELYEIFPDKIIIGVGGITSWQDVIEFILAGSNAVQIGSAIARHGFKIFQQITENLIRYLRVEGFNTITDLRGIAHRT